MQIKLATRRGFHFSAACHLALVGALIDAN